MDCRQNAEEPHGHKQRRPESSVFWGREGRRKQRHDSEHSHRRNGGEIDELPVGFTLEDVEDRGEEGGDDHDGDPHVVHPQQQDV